MPRAQGCRWIASMLLVTLMISAFPNRSIAQSQPQPDIDIRYSDKSAEVVQVQFTNKTVNPDGSISGDMALVSKSALTYGLAFSIEGGSISGPAFDQLLKFTDVSIPFVGSRTLQVGRVTFSPGAQLKLDLNKYGVFENEAIYILLFDLCTAITQYTGFGTLATTTSEFLDGLIQSALQLVQTLNNAGFDGAAMTAQLQRGDILGAFQSLGHMMEIAPQAFADFLLQNYKISLGVEQIKGFGKGLGAFLSAYSVFPLLSDLVTKPRAAEVIVRTIGTAAPSNTNIDLMLVIDRSGSMDGQPMIDAKKAAKLFVDLMHDGDQVGVASFSDAGSVDYALAPMNEASKAAAKAAVDGLVAVGATSIGGGLHAGQQELSNSGTTNHSRAMVLLSDGSENASPYVSDVLPSVIASQISVFTIGLGSGVNEALLQDIAIQTHGTYTFAPGSEQLDSIYNRLAGVVAGQQLVISSVGSVVPGGVDTQRALIGTHEATFAITWPTSSVDLSLTLVAPSGRYIDLGTAQNDPYIDGFKASGYAFFRITAPETGEWLLQTYNQSLAQVPATRSAAVDNAETYHFTVTELTELKLDAFMGADAIHPGEANLLTATLLNNQGGLSGATVTAIVEPTGEALTLFDDGLHGDEVAGDGIYADTFSNTSAPGTYIFHIHASGEGFTREKDVTMRVSDQLQPRVDLFISTTAPGRARPGDQIAYDSIYGNAGPNAIANGVIESVLPSGTSFISSTLGQPTSVAGNVLRWEIGLARAQILAMFSIMVQIEPTAVPGTTLMSTVSILSPDYTNELFPANNEASAITALDAPAGGANLLINSDFEQDDNGDRRPDGWSVNKIFTRSSEQIYSGGFSGKLALNSSTRTSVWQWMPQVAAGSAYTFSGYVNIPSASSTIDFQLELSWWSDNGQHLIMTVPIKHYSSSTSGLWQAVRTTASAPPGTQSATVRLVIKSLRGRIYVDRFAFQSS